MIQLHEICIMVERNWFLSVCLGCFDTEFTVSVILPSVDADNDDGVGPIPLPIYISITYNYTTDDLFYVVLNAKNVCKYVIDTLRHAFKWFMCAETINLWY